MKNVYYTFLLLIFSTLLNAQHISVASFRSLPMDMTARVTDAVKDQNGDKCALIKVVTTETGFAWEGGMLGVMKAVKKKGEYWVYVPYGAKKLTIKHDKLGVLRNYLYPEPIEEATVYEMVLTTGKVTTIVEEAEIETVWLLISSVPAGADVYIDDQYMGQTPFQKKLKKQQYTYRISKRKYQPSAGMVDLSEEEHKKMIDARLKPNFGTLLLRSKPEDGAEVIIDDELTDHKTPCIIEGLKTGNHIVRLRHKWYEPTSQAVEIPAGDEVEIYMDMQPSFGEIHITTDPPAAIYLDDQFKGNGELNLRQMPGVYKITARKQSYQDDSRSVEVYAGGKHELSLHLRPEYGVLDIATNPWGAEIFLNDKSFGQSPQTINKLLVGEYRLRISKDGYGDVLKNINISEGKPIILTEDLKKGKKIRILTKTAGVPIAIDGTQAGISPLSIGLSYGTHEISLNDGEVQQEINIRKSGKRQFRFNVGSRQTKGNRPNKTTAAATFFIDKRDKQHYATVVIGDQVWMAQNLNYAARGSWCYEDKEENCSMYGRLYDWETALKVCPSGWHLPTDEEWSALALQLGGSRIAGGKMKAKGQGWQPPNTGAGNESGFLALAAGDRIYRYGSSSYANMGRRASWWSATEFSENNAWGRYVYYNSAELFQTSYKKLFGRSVRCLKD